MTRLPLGFAAQLSDDVRVSEDGCSLLGGNPYRLVTVSAEFASMVRSGTLRVNDARSHSLVAALLDRGLADPVPQLGRRAAVGQVTIVVPVKDRAEELARLLVSIPRGLEVLVVDDGSDDAESIHEIASQFGASVLRFAACGGPAAARNAGLAAAQTDFVLFCDSDTELCAGAVERLLAHFDDSKVALVAPRICARQTAGGWLTRYEAACSSLDLGDRPALVQPRSRVSYVPSACLMVRRSAVLAGFDPELRVAEDVDLVWRVTAAGWRVRYEPLARVQHDHRTEFWAWFGRRRFYGTGAALLAQRHGSAVAPAVVAPWSVAAVALLLSRHRSANLMGLFIVLTVVLRIAAKLEKSRQPLLDAAQLAGRGLYGTVLQAAAVVTRHWWPVALLGCVVSRRFRGVALAAALADGAVDYLVRQPDLNPVSYWVARRLDDLAYGAGLWSGCWKEKNFQALQPDFTKW